jgi:progesterone-induced-blocking factor 1
MPMDADFSTGLTSSWLVVDKQKMLADERAAWFEERGMLRTELRQLCERLKMEKAHMSDLQISDTLAEQLARQLEDDLTVREFVQLHVYRNVHHLRSELATAQKEIESLREQCAGYKARAARADDEIAQVTKAADAKALRLQRELELSEASRSELENEIKRMCTQLEVFKDAQARSELESSRRPASVDVYTENEKLQSELQLAGDRHRLTADKNEELRRVVDEQQQQIALLCADKAFLQDAKRQLEDREMRLLAKQKELQSKADLTTAAQLAGAYEMSKVQEETRLAYEKQLAAEIDKFMEISKREIDTIRSNSQMVYERENRLLREARDDALKQIDLLQTRLQSVQSSLEEKILESTRMESAHATALSTSRNDLKMKHFEMNQLGLSLEERSAELRSAKLEIEMLQQKVRMGWTDRP